MADDRDSDAPGDFASALRRAGVAVPADRLAIMREAYDSMQELLRCSTTPDTNPWRRPQPLASVFNVTSHPVMAQPCGFAVNGLPLSAQFVGPAFDEATVLRVGHAYEQAAVGSTSGRRWRGCESRQLFGRSLATPLARDDD